MAVFNRTGAKPALKPMAFDLEIKEPPPTLILLINPDNLDIKFAHKTNEARVRWVDYDDSAYILQTHHDELDTLSASGKTAMFYSDKGITNIDATKSLAYENLQQLLAVFKNNGLNYNRRNPRYSVIESVGRVLITYDGYIYRGSFETLTITETAENPFSLDFSYDFKITEIMDMGTLMYNQFFTQGQG